MKKSLVKKVSYLISKEVGWFNGWKASEEMFNKSCEKAARAVIKKMRAEQKKDKETRC